MSAITNGIIPGPLVLRRRVRSVRRCVVQDNARRRRYIAAGEYSFR